MNYERVEYVDNFIKGGYVHVLDEIMSAYLHVIRFGVTTVWIWINWKRSAAYHALILSAVYPELVRYELNLNWLSAIFCRSVYSIIIVSINSSMRLKLGV